MAPRSDLPVLPASSPYKRKPQRAEWRHALSLFGDIKYPAGFKRFDYVNPDAPKGGAVRQFEVGTFDNFNPVVEGREGLDRRRRRADLRNLTTPVAGRGRRRTTGCSRSRWRYPDDRS